MEGKVRKFKIKRCVGEKIVSYNKPLYEIFEGKKFKMTSSAP